MTYAILFVYLFIYVFFSFFSFFLRKLFKVHFFITIFGFTRYGQKKVNFKQLLQKKNINRQIKLQ